MTYFTVLLSTNFSSLFLTRFHKRSLVLDLHNATHIILSGFKCIVPNRSRGTTLHVIQIYKISKTLTTYGKFQGKHPNTSSPVEVHIIGRASTFFYQRH